jgi:hypothetical protein
MARFGNDGKRKTVGRSLRYIAALAAGSALIAPGCGSTRASPSETEAESAERAPLFASKEWASFKAAWRRLDELPTETQSPGYIGYMADEAEIDSLRVAIEGAQASLRSIPPSLLPEDEAEFLSNLIFARFHAITRGAWIYYTRMIVEPWMETDQATLTRLEARIDQLVALRERGIVSGEEYDEALADVHAEIASWSIVNEIVRKASDLWLEALLSLEGADDPFETALKAIDLAWEDSLARREEGGDYSALDQAFRIARDGLLELRELVVRIRPLLDELER